MAILNQFAALTDTPSAMKQVFSVILQVLQTKTIISRYGTHFWNEGIEAFSHHPDILFSIVPCLYALLI